MRSLFVCAAAALSVATTLAQAPVSPAFDVVSVKRNVTGGPQMMRNAPGNVTMVNIPVRQVIRQAYGLQEFQIVGGPDWISSDRVDIDGRFDASTPVPGMTPPQRMQAMLRSLLADRFKLVARMESREMPIYALVFARGDGQLGPRMTPGPPECAAPAGGPPPGARRGGGPGLDGRGAPGAAPCSSRGGFGQYQSTGAPLAMFVNMLSQMTGRTVVDRTGLAGSYAIDLRWSPTPDQLPPGPPPPGVQPPPIDPSGPSLFTALEEQLGLKLESQRGPVDVLVIEHVEPPTDN